MADKTIQIKDQNDNVYPAIKTVAITATTDAWGQIVLNRFELHSDHFIYAFSTGYALFLNSDYVLRAFIVSGNPLGWATNATIDFTVVYR